jgi:polyisoprenoid-binding protein YceI
MREGYMTAMRAQLIRSATILLCLFAPALRAETGSGNASFIAHGPAGLRIEGTTEKATLASEADAFVITVDLTVLKTGIDVRDRHTRDDLDTAHFPLASLRVPRAAITLPAAGSRSRGTASGKLTLHGQSRDVTFTYEIEERGGSWSVEAALPIRLADFDIKPRRYLGVGVKDDVEASAKLSVTP